MSNISIFTSMTNPEERRDPWKEALNCYESFADEVKIIGKDFPYEFKWDYFRKIFQEAFNECKGSWVFRMDVDYFFHEKDLSRIKFLLKKFEDYPAIAFPQFQFFTLDRYQLKTKICLALNKKKFPNIQLNGGGDLVLPTLNGDLIKVSDVPNINIPIYQYESTFRTREIISEDRARFARAWFRQFGDYGNRGGGTADLAYDAWYLMIQDRYRKHTFKMKIDNHPVFIKNKLKTVRKDEFGYDAFGLKYLTKREFIYYLKGYKDKYF
jgi:hypothetical protein